MRRILALAFTASLVASAGCDLYFGGDDDDECAYGGADVPTGGAPQLPEGYRNPQTGQCEYLGGGGGGWCDPNCGPCPTDSNEAAGALPSWGMCQSSCTGLDEGSCLDAPGCRAAYIDDCPPGAPATCDMTWYYECWAVDQTGPVQGSCEGLDAYSCSMHDDCISVHDNACNNPGTDPNGDQAWCGLGWFRRCADEPTAATGCFSDSECSTGERCNAAEVCNPPPGCAGGTGTGNGLIDCTTCYGECVPDEPPPACNTLPDEVSCIDRSDCSPLYEGINCDCDPANPQCTCQQWQYVGCTDMDTAP
jgi:hypothetical protein